LTLGTVPSQCGPHARSAVGTVCARYAAHRRLGYSRVRKVLKQWYPAGTSSRTGVCARCPRRWSSEPLACRQARMPAPGHPCIRMPTPTSAPGLVDLQCAFQRQPLATAQVRARGHALPALHLRPATQAERHMLPAWPMAASCAAPAESAALMPDAWPPQRTEPRAGCRCRARALQDFIRIRTSYVFFDRITRAD
jgi:hypothetical protein